MSTSRRGKRSTVPPRDKDYTRRLKKQNLERKRRACISDRISALYNLAMSIIGTDPHEGHKVVKTDILSLCCSIFEQVENIAKDEPKLRSRLRSLSETSSLVRPKSIMPKDYFTSDIDKTDQNIMVLDEKSCSSDTYHQDICHHQKEQHSQLDTVSSTVTTTSSFSVPTYNYLCQMIDEDNKENKIPKLIIHNSIRNKPYTICSTVPDTVSIPDESLNYCVTPSLSSLESPPIDDSTPLNLQNLITPVYMPNNGTLTQWQSTPQQYSENFTLSLNNPDSGFFNSQSLEQLTPNMNRMSSFITTQQLINITTNCVDLVYFPVKSINTVHLSSNSLMNSLRCESTTPSLSPIVNLAKPSSDFSFKLKNMISLSSEQWHQQQCKTTSINSCRPLNTITSTLTTTDNNTLPVWRPYLD
ncbi:unnamed protein product [Heterobilharzia americana]|nr:unnamed protein product [Heterobilharzia americana]